MFSLIDLINTVGMEKIRVQPLLPSLAGVSKARGGGYRVTFITDQFSANDAMMSEPRVVGLVLWIPQDDFKRAASISKGK